MASISVRIDNDATSFKPGDTIRGTVTWFDISPESGLEILLLYKTEGIGTQDIEEINSVAVPNPPISGSQSFTFKLPEAPYSFEGELIALIWAVEAVSDDGDVSDSVEFVLSPASEPIRLQNLD